MNRKMLTVVGWALLGGSQAHADEAGWETNSTGSVTIKSRERPGTNLKEVWAEGDLDATVQDIQTVQMTPSRFPSFMPNVKMSRQIGKPEADGSVYVHTELALPVVQGRDYIVRVWLDEGVKPDGSGTFKNRWSAVPDKLPERSNLVRVKVNDGSWVVTPTADGKKSHVVYRFAFDPGGWIPAAAGSWGNREGVMKTFEATEKEANRLKAEREKKAASAP